MPASTRAAKTGKLKSGLEDKGGRAVASAAALRR